MSQLEIDIIQKLSAKAAEPSADFSVSLRTHLVELEQDVLKNRQHIRRQKMTAKKIAFGILGILVLAIVAGLAIFSGTEVENQSEQTAVTTPTSTTQTSSLPSQQLQSLDEARKMLTFAPLIPSLQLNGEKLNAIKVGAKGGMIDDSDTLYLSYADTKGILYKISETSKLGNYPDDASKVTLNISGKSIKASFYQLASSEESGSVTSAGSDAASPASYLFWTDAGVNFEISEFGRVTKQQLVQLANSLK